MSSGIPEVDVQQAATAIEAGAVLIDVREQHEFDEVHAAGAKLIALGEIAEHTEDLPATETFYVICKSGGRSARAVSWFRQQGFDAVNVAGGTMAWVEAGLSTQSVS